jgi:hypothetical protein
VIRLFITRSGVLALVLITSACGGKTPGAPNSPAATVVSIALSGTAALTAGQTSALTATASLSDGSTQNVTAAATWTSSNLAVASVASTGMVSTVAPGTATITASYQGKDGSLGITVARALPKSGPGNAHLIILWTRWNDLVSLSDAQLDMWKARGIDGFVAQTRYLYQMGGLEVWTGDPNDPLSSAPVEGADVHVIQRALRDSHFAERCHQRGIAVYLGFYLSNYHNLSTPLKVWDDDAGWNEIVVPEARNVAAAAKLLGMDGIATDSENYRSDSQTWDWKYPGVTHDEATVRALARQRGTAFMKAVLEGFPNVEIINYRIEIPGDWEEKVQLQVNHVAGVWDKSVFPDFWGGIADAGGFYAIHFFDPIFYKSWQVGSGWDAALSANLAGVRKTLSQRWANWDYASPRFFLSPFAWIDPGPSAGSFDDARPVDYVAAQLTAFHKWGEGNMFGLYAQHILDFDYAPYVPAMVAASAPDPGTTVAGLASTDIALPSQAPTPFSESAPAPVVGDQMRLEAVLSGLHDTTAAAFSPDGRLFIAERAGTIVIAGATGLRRANALALEDVSTSSGNGLMAIAIDPDFARTHFLYALYTAASSPRQAVFRLARLTETNGTFGSRAILLDRVPAPATQAAAAARFGLDGMLYIALGAGGDPLADGSVASYNGKILRLEPDGRTPPDQVGATPIFATGLAMPRGLDLQSHTGTVWLAGADAAAVPRLRGLSRASVSGAAVADSSLTLPISAMTFVPDIAIQALAGKLLIGGDDGSIARVDFDPRSPATVRAVVPLVRNSGTSVRALVVSPQGIVYVCTRDGLFKLVTP